MERYYDKKAKREGSKRVCSMPTCDTVLSRYNDSDICAVCDAKEASQGKQMLGGLIV